MAEHPAHVDYMIFSSMICFLAIWTNYIIIRTILKNKSMRTPTNAYISNWAIYDLLYLILVPINFLIETYAKDAKDAEPN
ncbi:hypothetical protein QE152_g13811 [Popillia japonica]|uniref:G-protein coupled receptors family 1 profile domain-containing protein n=1 Tax=Popillia japonica TaxID=7064 RepID=A0AAW1LC17_POPJA